jgi:flavin reductase (DIM6/NTAB) family NADH-FMN oxidoreductase RutF
MNTKSPPAFDKRDLRNALGSFGTGVTVVTSGNKQTRFVGVTANSFSSVSLEPPIVLWSLGSASPSLDIFDATGRFVINILSLQQMDLSKWTNLRALTCVMDWMVYPFSTNAWPPSSAKRYNAR